MSFDKEQSWEIYAKLISEEDITLRYSGRADTAYFNLNNREIVIPTFEFLNNSATQYMVSHEIGHAKFTTIEPEMIRSLNKKFGNVFNILEDARIERLMKKEFAGLSSIFKAGVKTLLENDMFGIKGSDINTLSFLAKLNLFHKAGSLLSIDFNSQTEYDICNRMMETNTIEDVIDLCKEVCDYIDKIKEEKSNQGNDIVFVDSDDDSESTPNSSDNGNTISNNSSSNSNSEEKDDKGESGVSSSDGDETSDDKTDSSNNDNPDKSNDYNDEVTENFQKRLNEMIRENADDEMEVKSDMDYIGDYQYKKIDVTKFYDIIEVNKMRAAQIRSINNNTKLIKKLAGIVNQTFLQNKTANELRNRFSKPVGKIDTKRLYKFLTSTDIFKKKVSIKEGVNHGIVILIDFSGSMNSDGKMLGSMIQACVLGEFCRMNDIPFEIMGFGMCIRYYNDETRDYDINRLVCNATIANIFNFDIQKLLCIAEGYLANGLLIKCGNRTPTYTAMKNAIDTIKGFKDAGIEKTYLYVITDGAYNDVVISDTQKLIINNSLISIDKSYCDKFRDWTIEFPCKYLKDKYNTEITIMFIANAVMFYFDMSPRFHKMLNELYDKKQYDKSQFKFGLVHEALSDRYNYLYKHGILFENVNKLPVPFDVTNENENGERNRIMKNTVYYKFEHNPFLSQYILINSKAFKGDMDTNEDKITKKLKKNNFLNLIAANFIKNIA